MCLISVRCVISFVTRGLLSFRPPPRPSLLLLLQDAMWGDITLVHWQRVIGTIHYCQFTLSTQAQANGSRRIGFPRLTFCDLFAWDARLGFGCYKIAFEILSATPAFVPSSCNPYTPHSFVPRILAVVQLFLLVKHTKLGVKGGATLCVHTHILTSNLTSMLNQHSLVSHLHIGEGCHCRLLSPSHTCSIIKEHYLST